jgi:hypothetical protein
MTSFMNDPSLGKIFFFEKSLYNISFLDTSFYNVKVNFPWLKEIQLKFFCRHIWRHWANTGDVINSGLSNGPHHHHLLELSSDRTVLVPSASWPAHPSGIKQTTIFYGNYTKKLNRFFKLEWSSSSKKWSNFMINTPIKWFMKLVPVRSSSWSLPSCFGTRSWSEDRFIKFLCRNLNQKSRLFYYQNINICNCKTV